MNALPPTGTVTFLFTDIEGSTGLWDEHAAVMQVALARHDEILRGAIAAHNGRVFSTGGDGVAAAFQRAADAVAAALDAQHRLQAESWPEGVPLRVRMGAHTGEAQERDADYFGPPVNRAARVMGASHGGQVVVSSVTASLLERTQGIELMDLGAVRLKGIAEPVHVFGVHGNGVAWVDRPLTGRQETRGNLPYLQTEYVGRLADLRQRGLTNHRLVTLTGAGGVGKTRNAIEQGWLMIDEFADGAWLIELAPVADPAAVHAAVASTLGAQPQPDMAMVQAIVDWCRGRRALIVVDNCEHVLDPVVELVSAIVAGAPTITILATSREPLGVPGELVVRIPSLDPKVEGSELFCLRAAAVDDAFAPTDADLVAIASICARLDGIPLAIELAAARIRSLAPAELLDRLDDRFRLLRGSGRGGLERHQTLRAAVVWSYQLLSETERALFDRLSVFAGGFDLGAAEKVCSSGPVDEYEVVDLLGSLVDKSMVVADRAEHGTRYRLLETLRQYGEERLNDRAETSNLRDAHLAHYRDVARRADEQWLSPAQLEADAVFDREWDNLRAAHAWAVTMRDLASAEAIVRDTFVHVLFRVRHEHGEWVHLTLGLDDDAHRPTPDTYAAAAYWAAVAAGWSESDDLIELASCGIARAASPDHPDAAFCWCYLSIPYAAAGPSDKARDAVAHLRRAALNNPRPYVRWLALMCVVAADVLIDIPSASDDVVELGNLSRQIGSPTLVARHAYYNANTILSTDPRDVAAALLAFRTAASLAQEAAAAETEVVSLCLVAFCSVLLDTPDARWTVEVALARAYDVRYWAFVVWALEQVPTYFVTSGDRKCAAEVLGYLLEHHPSAWPDFAAQRERNLATIAQESDAERLMARGAAMDSHQVVAYALAQLTAARQT
ncbi:MAG: adenylate/guanylate cyclase domain-containing protein [Dehalococcoidia bacterium]